MIRRLQQGDYDPNHAKVSEADVACLNFQHNPQSSSLVICERSVSLMCLAYHRRPSFCFCRCFFPSFSSMRSPNCNWETRV